MTVAAFVAMVVGPRAAAAQCSPFSIDPGCGRLASNFHATFVPPDPSSALPAPSHAQRPRPATLAQPLRTHRDARPGTVDCAMAVPANPDIDQRMTLLHPPPDIKFSMRLIVVPPCKR
jgi:hypothetical protein